MQREMSKYPRGGGGNASKRYERSRGPQSASSARASSSARDERDNRFRNRDDDPSGDMDVQSEH